jgi:hypothetical protein
LAENAELGRVPLHERVSDSIEEFVMNRRCFRPCWMLALSSIAMFGSSARPDPPASVYAADDLLDQVRADAPPPRSAAKPDGTRFTVSAERYAEVKILFRGPRTFAKTNVDRAYDHSIPDWLTPTPQAAEEESLRKVREVGFVSLDKETLQATFSEIVGHHSKGSDAFLDAMTTKRPELVGLPFLRGDSCRLTAADVRNLSYVSSATRSLLESRPIPVVRPKDEPIAEALAKGGIAPLVLHSGKHGFNSAFDWRPRDVLPGLLQILATQPAKHRVDLVRMLESLPPGDDAANAALVRLALFDADADVRKAAIQALQREPTAKFGPKLIDGFRYPWPIVGERAAEAMVALKRFELLPTLAALLDEPDPAGPVEAMIDGMKTPVLREVVKMNHHRNCALCHAPLTNPAEARKLVGLVARIPASDEPLPAESSRIYYELGRSKGPTIPAIRANETYLRQDFSMLEAVENHGRWPQMQRYDFLVRTRPLAPDEAEAMLDAPTECPSPHRRAVLLALSGLTSKYRGPSAADWRAEISPQTAAK